MAPLASPAGTWVRQDVLAELITVTDRTLRNWRARGQVETRQQLVDGRRVTEVLVESLPLTAQQTFLERRAQIERAADEERAKADAKLEAELSSDDVASRLARYDEKTRDAFMQEATRRHELVQMWLAADKQLGGEWAPAARAIMQEWACPDPLVLAVRPSWAEPGTPATLYRLAKRVQDIGILALVPDAPKASRPDDRRLTPIAPEVLEEIRRLRLVHHTSATQASLYRKLRARFGDETPSESTFKRLLRKKVSRAEMVLARDGERALNARAGAHVNRSYDELDVGEWFCGDEHQFDVMVINPYRGGALDRPWITAFTDLRTRLPIGWCISFEHNTQTIIEAFIHGVRPKKHEVFANLCGLPKAMYIDNGKDYRSARLEFLVKQLNVELHHALPFNAKAKNVERQFGTICAQFSRDQVGYFGNKPSDRPGRYPELVAKHEAWLANKPGAETPFMTLGDFKVAFADFVVEWAQRESDAHFEWETGRSRSPLAVAGDRRENPRIPRHEVLEYLALPRFQRTVRRGQIKIDNLNYRHDALLALGMGEHRVLCCRSQADITELLVYDLGGRFLCIAKAAPVLPTVTGHMSEATLKEIKATQRANRRLVQQYRELQERALSGDDIVEERTPEPEPPTSAAPGSSATPASVIELFPKADRQLRAAQEDRDDTAPAPAIELPTPPSRDDEAAVIEQLGPRPVVELWLTQAEAARVAEDQEIWDRDFAALIERRRQHRAAQAAKGAPQ